MSGSLTILATRKLESQELERGLAEYFQADSESLFKQLYQGILQGRPQAADETAAAAMLVVNDQASAITGQTLNVDGGTAFC